MSLGGITVLVAVGLIGVIISVGLGQWIGDRLARRARKQVSASPTLFDAANDAPLVHPSADALGYAPFARQLAQSIRAISAPKGFVFSVTGEWGTGKTTLLNFVEHYLSEESEDPVDLVRFNPWWFSGREDLTRRFFDHLQVALKGLGVVDANTAAEIKRLEEALASAGAPNLLRMLLTLSLPRDDDIPDLKERVAQRLAHRDRPIVVFIDDIDRLTPQEIADVVLLVKGVADFPNVLYVLAFDHQVVVDALSKHSGSDGAKYLEKIVQASVDLPAPDPVALRDIFLTSLNAIVRETPEELFESSHWANTFWDGIAPLLTTPRIVIRLLNALRMTYPPLREEVSGVDFVALEVIRVVANDVYHIIRSNPDQFLGDLESREFPISSHDPQSAFHRAWLENLSEPIRSVIQALVSRLFPRVDAALGGRGYFEGPARETWKRARRICHPDIFPIFFHLAVPEGSKSRSEMQALLTLVGDQDAFSKHLLAAANQVTRRGVTEARVQLEELITYIDDIPDDAVRSVVNAFFDIGDALLIEGDKGHGFTDFANDIRIGRIVWALLKRFPEHVRFEYLRDAISAGDAVSLASHEAVTLAQQHGEHSGSRRSPDEQIVNSAHLGEVKDLVIGKIEKAAEEGRLANRPDLGNILYRWKTWGDEERVMAWVNDLIKTDAGFLTLIKAFSRQAQTYGAGDRVARTLTGIGLSELADFTNPDEAIERARALQARTDLSSDERATIELLLKTGERREAGHDPDFPFDH